MPSKYEVHPIANIFPMMTAEEYSGLLEDIREHGQRDNGIVYDGKIIDGRNRYRACQELGIEFQYYELEPGDDPISYVISANLHRRMLDASQRAQCAAAVANLKRGGDRKSDEIKVSKDTLISVEEAAKSFQVSTASVKRAKHVADKGDQAVVDAVKSGEIKVSAAAKLVKAVPDKKEQRKILKGGKKAVAEAVRKTKDKPKPKKEVEPVEPIEPDDDGPEPTTPTPGDDFTDRLIKWCRMQLENLDLTPGQMATAMRRVANEVGEW